MLFFFFAMIILQNIWIIQNLCYHVSNNIIFYWLLLVVFSAYICGLYTTHSLVHWISLLYCLLPSYFRKEKLWWGCFSFNNTHYSWRTFECYTIPIAQWTKTILNNDIERSLAKLREIESHKLCEVVVKILFFSLFCFNQ